MDLQCCNDGLMVIYLIYGNQPDSGQEVAGPTRLKVKNSTLFIEKDLHLIKLQKRQATWKSQISVYIEIY